MGFIFSNKGIAYGIRKSVFSSGKIVITFVKLSKSVAFFRLIPSVIAHFYRLSLLVA